MGITKIVLNTILVIVLFASPGLTWSYLFFKKGEIDWVERAILSIGFGMALVPMVLFMLNYFCDMRVTRMNISVVIAILTLIPLFLNQFRCLLQR